MLTSVPLAPSFRPSCCPDATAMGGGSASGPKAAVSPFCDIYIHIPNHSWAGCVFVCIKKHTTQQKIQLLMNECAKKAVCFWSSGCLSSENKLCRPPPCCQSPVRVHTTKSASGMLPLIQLAIGDH